MVSSGKYKQRKPTEKAEHAYGVYGHAEIQIEDPESSQNSEKPQLLRKLARDTSPEDYLQHELASEPLLALDPSKAAALVQFGYQTNTSVAKRPQGNKARRAQLSRPR